MPAKDRHGSQAGSDGPLSHSLEGLGTGAAKRAGFHCYPTPLRRASVTKCVITPWGPDGRLRVRMTSGAKATRLGGHCGLARRKHGDRRGAGCGGEPLVVDDNSREVIADLQSGGQMNGIQ